ncbi:ABC transporter ATP-binding protein [Peptacetobacter hiranonis]|uniref:ABC transporter, ATP-binding protein n=1 Tax=Peptacetobacter hiranonis (strain DSM 13275 / JCM 10541 / KCTC 15199 / TO-931) TaxID=500633 RepID=B6FXH5_PEPHT|nr:ABC transporter ATP-binding protein [Peptacetobacter hiranonis]EEA85760.1 ABC transporter, ATP-binding protein [Peptacetobacter hiranonis DSM 13275]QEK20612.1 putative ABC transporter ATP-binding protein [Peptacetobacter hiranonis]
MAKKLKRFESINTLLKYLKPYRRGFIISIVMLVVTCAAMVTSPNVEGMITNSILKDVTDLAKGVPGARFHMENVIKIIILLLFIYAVKTAAQMISMICITNSIQDTMKDLRNACIEKINALPVKTLDSHPKGDILSRITNDIDAISNAMQQTFMNVISGVLMVCFAIFMMFRVNLVMTLCVLVIIPISYIIIKKIAKVSQESFDIHQRALGDLSANVTESFSGYNEIILFGKQEESVKKFEKINENIRETAYKAQFLSYLMSPLLSLLTYLAIGVVSVIGTIYAIGGVITVGQLQAFVRFIWQVNEPLTQVSQLSSQIQSALSAMDRIHEFIEYEEETDVERKEMVFDGNVEFKDIRFGYGKKEVLHGVSLYAKKGETVAIVGPTGSGKTTIVNLLMRFYDPNSGSIAIDGVDSININRRTLRDNIGMVLQDTWLFTGSIRENIRFSKPDATDEEIEQACKYANADEFISTLPKGYDTVIDEEADNISQGEKQLLTIARAILKDPKVLILDEATSSIDTKTEKNIQDAMDYLMEGRTSFIIAHRLSTIKNADKILVLKDGNIIECGNHNELMKENGFYANLYNSQFNN